VNNSESTLLREEKLDLLNGGTYFEKSTNKVEKEDYSKLFAVWPKKVEFEKYNRLLWNPLRTGSKSYFISILFNFINFMVIY
jgi:hypothetical protein